MQTPNHCASLHCFRLHRLSTRATERRELGGRSGAGGGGHGGRLCPRPRPAAATPSPSRRAPPCGRSQRLGRAAEGPRGVSANRTPRPPRRRLRAERAPGANRAPCALRARAPARRSKPALVSPLFSFSSEDINKTRRKKALLKQKADEAVKGKYCPKCSKPSSRRRVSGVAWSLQTP